MRTNINYEVKLLSEISIEINKELLTQSCIVEMPENSRRIISAASFLTKLPIFLISKSLLRYSDFAKVNWFQVILAEYLSIYQSKTKKPIRFDFYFENIELRKKLLLYLHITPVWNYNQISAEILRIVRSELSQFNLHFKHQTHIFRHIFATEKERNGFNHKHIANRLGHSTETLRNSYIHPEISL